MIIWMAAIMAIDTMIMITAISMIVIIMTIRSTTA